MDVCICITESLSYTAEMITLQTNYTSIKPKKKKKKKKPRKQNKQKSKGLVGASVAGAAGVGGDGKAGEDQGRQHLKPDWRVWTTPGRQCQVTEDFPFRRGIT